MRAPIRAPSEKNARNGGGIFLHRPFGLLGRTVHKGRHGVGSRTLRTHSVTRGQPWDPDAPGGDGGSTRPQNSPSRNTASRPGASASNQRKAGAQMLKHIRIRGTILIGAVAVLAVALSPQAFADPATGSRNPSTATSPDGSTMDPAVLAGQIDATVEKAEAPSPKGAAKDGADRDSAAAREGVIGPMSAPGINSIIGTDDRYATNPANWWPASSTVYFTRTVGAAINRWCTGWLINANTVITAGHCVHTGGAAG